MVLSRIILCGQTFITIRGKPFEKETCSGWNHSLVPRIFKIEKLPSEIIKMIPKVIFQRAQKIRLVEAQKTLRAIGSGRFNQIEVI